MRRRPSTTTAFSKNATSTSSGSICSIAAGARVVHREDVLTCTPPLPGKGEVLWRSLAATTGDLICFVDADLEQFSSAVVRGVLGPLLADPRILLVKAAYERPLTDGATVHPAGGGRVTCGESGTFETLPLRIEP